MLQTSLIQVIIPPKIQQLPTAIKWQKSKMLQTKSPFSAEISHHIKTAVRMFEQNMPFWDRRERENCMLCTVSDLFKLVLK